jgi:hypothetical protein
LIAPPVEFQSEFQAGIQSETEPQPQTEEFKEHVETPQFNEVKNFLRELNKVTDNGSILIMVGSLRLAGESLDHLIYLGSQFSFLKPIAPIVDSLLSSHKNSPDSYMVSLGSTQFTKVNYLNQIGLKNIMEELEKIRISRS